MFNSVALSHLFAQFVFMHRCSCPPVPSALTLQQALLLSSAMLLISRRVKATQRTEDVGINDGEMRKERKREEGKNGRMKSRVRGAIGKVER